ncbi:MAG: hypothetical protein ABTA16_05085 [Niallia sp.]
MGKENVDNDVITTRIVLGTFFLYIIIIFVIIEFLEKYEVNPITLIGILFLTLFAALILASNNAVNSSSSKVINTIIIIFVELFSLITCFITSLILVGYLTLIINNLFFLVLGLFIGITILLIFINFLFKRFSKHYFNEKTFYFSQINLVNVVTVLTVGLSLIVLVIDLDQSNQKIVIFSNEDLLKDEEFNGYIKDLRASQEKVAIDYYVLKNDSENELSEKLNQYNLLGSIDTEADKKSNMKILLFTTIYSYYTYILLGNIRLSNKI